MDCSFLQQSCFKLDQKRLNLGSPEKREEFSFQDSFYVAQQDSKIQFNLNLQQQNLCQNQSSQQEELPFFQQKDQIEDDLTDSMLERSKLNFKPGYVREVFKSNISKENQNKEIQQEHQIETKEVLQNICQNQEVSLREQQQAIFQQIYDTLNNEQSESICQDSFQVKQKTIEPTNKSPIKFKEFKLQTESRGRSKQRDLDQRLKEQQENLSQSRIFKAHQIPDYKLLSQKFINSQIKSPKPTVPQPFQLQTDQRSLLTERSQDKKLNQSKLENSFEFKARQMPDLSKSFTPRKMEHKPIEIKQFLLKSDSRSLQRKQFDDQIKQKLDLIEQQRREQKEKEEQEKSEKEFRASFTLSNVFKAAPIRHYKPIDVSSIPKMSLTSPKAPNFITEQRIEIRKMGQSQKIEQK